MNKLTSIALAVSIALTGVACGDKAENQTQQQQQVKSQALSSGIELANIDTNIRPQDDFYRYVNGNWLANTQIPADKSNYGSFTALYEQSQAALKKVVEAAAANKTAEAGSEERKLGDFYNSYMNEEKLNQLGLSPLAPYLDKIFALNNSKQLAPLMAEIKLAGGNLPFGWYVNNDAKNSSQYAVYLYQTGLGLPDRDYYLNTDEKFTQIRQQYKEYIAGLFTLAQFENANERAEQLVALESELAKIQWDRVASRDASKTYNKLTTDQAAALFGQFDFGSYLGHSNLSINDLIVSQPSYIKGLAALLNEQPLAVWQDYLAFHFINNYANLLSHDFEQHRFAFFGKTLSGVTEQAPRWKRAVDSANDVLGEMLGKEYVKTYFPPEAKARMTTLVDNLMQGFAVSIDELSWMTPETKVAAKEKLANFTTKIGYPDSWKDYSALEIKADDLVGNFIRHSQWAFADMSAKLGKPVDRSEWFMTPQTVNAYYNPVNNEIVFPAAILQPPFFNLAADDAVNYGAIGAVIGHELGHGFDDQGAKYDGSGNLRNWWKAEDLTQFELLGAKLATQYDGYKPFEDAAVNGRFTLGENIGDLGGLAVAYKAYQMSLNGTASPVLDGFTGEQRFFMGWSQIWRRKYRDEELRNRLMTDPHSPSEYRVIGVLSNMPAFYQAFDVKAGDKMYLTPEQQVKIW